MEQEGEHADAKLWREGNDSGGTARGMGEGGEQWQTRGSEQGQFASVNLTLLLTPYVKGGGGGSGFFLAYEDLGRTFDNSFPACAFFKVDSRSRT